MDQKLAESIESRPWSLDVGATSFGTSNAWNQLEIHVTFFFQRQKAGVCVCVSPPPKKKNSKNACPARNFQRSIFAKKKAAKTPSKTHLPFSTQWALGPACWTGGAGGAPTFLASLRFSSLGFSFASLTDPLTCRLPAQVRGFQKWLKRLLHSCFFWWK